MVENLPKLPGYSFHNLSLTNSSHYKTKHFGFKHGFRVSFTNSTGPGGRDLDSNSIGFLQPPTPPCLYPYHTYGRNKNLVPTPMKNPHQVDYDKKVLFFKAFMKQPVCNSAFEHYRVRHFLISYYLEDDTIKIIEPKIQNSGLMQGPFLSRQKIPNRESGQMYNWRDLNIGRDHSFFGHVMHIVDCDTFTREFFASQAIVLNPTEDLPPDAFTETYLAKHQPTTQTPFVDDKLRRFLEFGGEAMLKFYCVWENADSETTEMREHVLFYNLEDDTVSAREVRRRNDGLEAFPFVFRRYKAPKTPPHEYPVVCLEQSDQDVDEYYQPKDFQVGNTVFILGRRFLITDCDPFTRKYFKLALNIDQKPKLEIPEPPCRQAKKIPITVPPHVSKLGSIEDTIEQYKHIKPQRPQIDEKKPILNSQKYLRYSAELVSPHPEDQIRKFTISYSLADNTIKIHEPPIRNSGIWGGKFLNQQLIEKPGSDPNWPSYYTADDFYIGAIISIFKHRFRITGTDLFVYNYIKTNPEKFSQKVIDNIRNYMFQEGLLKEEIDFEQKHYEDEQKRKEIQSPGTEPVKKPTFLEICTNKPPAYVGELRPVRQPGENIGRGSFIRKEIKNAPEKQYGIPEPEICRIIPVIGDIESTECEHKDSNTKKIPCCLLETCPEKVVSDETEHPAAPTERYYADLIRKHNEVCQNTEGYYNLDCPRENCSIKKDSTKRNKEHTVRFVDDPSGKCNQ